MKSQTLSPRMRIVKALVDLDSLISRVRKIPSQPHAQKGRY